MRGAAGGVHSRLSTRTALQCMSASTAGIIESYMIATVESGTATRADVTRVTKRLGDEIGRVYGWRFPPVREAARER